MATGGEMTAGTRSHEVQFTLDEMCALADEAHHHGLPITAHAHAAQGVANAVAAGFDMVEHATFMTADSAHADDEVLDAIIRAGVVVSVTGGSVPGMARPPRIAALLPAMLAVFRRLYEAGVTIVCSSDAGIGPPKPHDVLPYSIATMVESVGVPPVAALRSATSVAAEACGVGDRKGRLAPGFDADILAVDGDPLVDVGALRAVTAVFRAGLRVR
jgi:imidazolonepropionase-like amidohydrolase